MREAKRLRMTVARMVVCECLSTVGLAEPPSGSPQAGSTCWPYASSPSSITRTEIQPLTLAE
ncbi:hypothetical protein AB0I77_17710 [Streptomyces sp. NPDC050619]|uniref:hypothetical protein n=1 Tax=Streptomyces sp. NPDC050619 TaxID=3157214 RepID=UPI003427C72F